MNPSLTRLEDGSRSGDEPLEFLDRLYNVAYWMVQDPPQAEEIVERSYLRVSEQIQRGEVAYDALCRAVIQVSMQTLWFQPPSTEPGGEPLDPHRPWLVHEPRAVVAAGLSDLPPTIRAAVVLHDVDHRSDGEAAAILNWPVRRVQCAVHAGRGQVQQRLAQPLPIVLAERPGSPEPTALRSLAPASSNPSRKRLLSSMRQRLRSKAERAERGNVIRQRPSAVGVLPADWEYVTRIAPGMGEDPLMRLIKLGIGSPNTSDWR